MKKDVNSQKTTFTIVIPTYNAEKYLEECLNSIQNQTYGDYEVIIINDGSTDNSLEIVEKFAKKDERFKVFSYVNGGISEARNRGINQATGEYLIFVDADDTINPELLEKLKPFTEKEIDIIRFNAIVEGDKKWKNPYRFNATYKEKVFSGAQAIKRWSNPKTRYATACLYCTKKDLYTDNGIKFEKVIPYEDVATVPVIIGNAKTVAMLDYIGYNYIQRPNSITNTSGYDKRKKNILGFILAYDVVNESMKKVYRKNPDEPDLENIFVEDFFTRLENKYKEEKNFQCKFDLVSNLANRHNRFSINHNVAKYYTASNTINDFNHNILEEEKVVFQKGLLTVSKLGEYSFKIKGIEKKIGIFRMERKDEKNETEMQFLFFSNNDFEKAELQPELAEIVDKYLLSYTNLFLAQMQNGNYIGEITTNDKGEHEIKFDEDITTFARQFTNTVDNRIERQANTDEIEL